MEEKEFAVIESGSKQYKVTVGDVFRIEKLPDEHQEGDTLVFDKVLMVDNGQDTTIGTPYIKGAKVEATFQKAGRSKKIPVIRYRAKSRHFKNRGHRQPYVEVKITAIS